MTEIGRFNGATGDSKQLHEIPWKEYLEKKNYNKDINQMCPLCIKDQIKKYGQVTIKCEGLLSGEKKIPQELRHHFSEEEVELVEQAINPYKWAEKNIDTKNDNPSTKLFSHRWYQEFILRCLHEDSLIAMSDGMYKKIKDIEVGDIVLSYNETKRTVPHNEVLNKWDNGVKPVYRISLENGDYLDVTDNHPILAHFKDGDINPMFGCKSYKTVYKSIQDGLSVGMDVYTLNSNNIFGNIHDIDLAKILGYIITDGYVNLKKSIIQFTNIRKQYVDEFSALVKKKFGCDVRLKTEAESYKNGIHRKKTYFAYVTNSKKLKNFLYEIGCIDKFSREMSILDYINSNLDKDSISAFINRAYSGDGCVYTHTAQNGHSASSISIHGKIGNFIPAWRMLLRKIGIFSPRVRIENRNSGNGMRCYFTRSDDIIRFFEFVGPIFGKEHKSEIALREAKSKTRNVKKSGRFNTTTRTKIISIELIGEKKVYDIEVKNRHNFIANNIVVHNCSSRRKAIRAGRRVGKCISEDAMIPLKSGRVITARQLLSEYSNGVVNEILTFDTQTSKITTTKIFDVFENGEKDVFTLTTKTGKKIDITDNHPFLTIGDDGNYNWVEAKDLKIGNMIGCPSKISIFGDNDIGDDLSRFIGYITGDGSITNGVSFTNGDFEVFSDFINTTKKVWNNSSVTYKNYPNKKTGNDRFTGNVVFRESKGNDAISFLKGIGMFGKNAYTKTTPEIIMTSTKSNVKNYLMGLFETDGWAALGRSLPDNRKTRSVQVGYTSASEMLARSVKHLLLRFGIVATIREKRVNYKNELRKYFCVEFSSKKNIEIFANEIGFISNRKRNCLNMIMDELSRKNYCGNESINLMPKEILSPVYKYIEEEKLSARKIVDDPINERIRKIYNVSKDKVKRYAEKIQNAKLTEIASSDVMWDEIKSIEYAGVKKTIDLSVPETNSFVTEDIITHNTQSIAMGIVHKMLTNEKYYVLVVTPFDAQAEEVYVKVKQILNNLKESYDELVYSAKESPNYQVTLNNGSRVRCFTAGSSGAAQVRGQPANLIYIDECDYLGQKDFNSILAILLDKPDTELWVTSTPNGEKQLYRLSQDKAYKEFHFPSYVLPHYSDDLDNDLRSQSDDTGYVQEVMAEFSTSRDGVFQPYYVDMCSKIKTIAPSAEEVLANRSNFIVTMGCDWNHQNIGTRIIALVYDRKNNLFSILDKATVAKEGWTQTAAMEKIIEFNRQYRFDKIYVDRGFGYTQIETLKSFAMAQFGKLPKGHPDLLLAEVVGIDFGSKIEVQDPYTNQTVKKDIKPFMVSVLNKVIEKIAIKLDGKKDAAIMAQLKGYEEKRSASGRPTYSASSATVGDHDLDALMLAMFAFNVEYDEIFSSMKSQLAINILTSQDMHGKDVSHLNPNHNKTTLEIKTKRRDNYSPGSRTVMFKQSIQFEERGSPGEIRSDMFYNGNWTGQTKLNRTAHRRASFK